MIDRKIMRISASAILAVLLIVFILPIGESGRIATAIFLIPASVVIPILIKKRSILSINRHQVLLILTATALVLVMFYFLSGIWFGFYRNPYSPSIDNLLIYALPCRRNGCGKQSGKSYQHTEKVLANTLFFHDPLLTFLYKRCALAHRKCFLQSADTCPRLFADTNLLNLHGFHK